MNGSARRDIVAATIIGLCVVISAHGVDAAEPIVGVKLTRLKRAPEAVVDDLADARINTVFARRRVVSTDGFIAACRERGITVYAIFGTLVDAAAIRDEPGLSQINALGQPMTARRKNYRLVCPNSAEYRQRKIKTITDFMARHEIDGLSLDFIRYGVEWEMVKPDESPGLDQHFCFCPRCLTVFGREHDLPFGEGTKAIAQHILQNHRKAWTQFKSDSITDLVAQIKTAARKIDPQVQIAIHALPWTSADYDDGPRRLGGQDFGALTEYVDLFSPMCYHHMLYREPKSIRDQVRYMKRLGCRVAPCVQAALIFREDGPYTPAMFEQAVEVALAEPSDGINLYIWRYLDQRPKLKDVWLEALHKRRR